MKKIKYPARNRLCQQSLEKSMCVKLNNKHVNEFKHQRSLRHWYNSSTERRANLGSVTLGGYAKVTDEARSHKWGLDVKVCDDQPSVCACVACIEIKRVDAPVKCREVGWEIEGGSNYGKESGVEWRMISGCAPYSAKSAKELREEAEKFSSRNDKVSAPRVAAFRKVSVKAKLVLKELELNLSQMQHIPGIKRKKKNKIVIEMVCF